MGDEIWTFSYCLNISDSSRLPLSYSFPSFHLFFPRSLFIFGSSSCLSDVKTFLSHTLMHGGWLKSDLAILVVRLNTEETSVCVLCVFTDTLVCVFPSFKVIKALIELPDDSPTLQWGPITNIS